MKKTAAHPPVTLPPALDAVLDGFEDRLLAMRLRELHRAAAGAMESLGYLNLVQYEPDSAEEGPADLDMWEKMAKPVADTIATVSTALRAMQKFFPRAFRDSHGPDTDTEVTDWKTGEEIESVVRGLNKRLQYELDEVRNQLRRPDVVSSRWRLLHELQEVRAGFRRQLGDLVYLTANALAQVQREAVVPGYQGEISRMVELRRIVADLTRSLGGPGQRLFGGMEPERIAEKVLEDLATVHDQPHWKHLPAEVKRSLLGLRDGLKGARGKKGDAQALRMLLELSVEKLSTLTQTMSHVLEAHDREVWAECSARLEQIELHLNLGSVGGPRILSEAVEVAGALYGRDPRLDGWLGITSGVEIAKLSEAALREELARFKEQLEVLPFH